MTYQEDYDKAAQEIKEALQELQIAESRVLALQRKMAALTVLISPDGPETDLCLKVLRATKRPVEQLRRIFVRSEGPLTVKELRQELRLVGCDLSQQANPSGTIGALCARLAEQGVVRRTQKAGRIAWERAV